MKSALFDGMKISIDRSKKVTLVCDGFNASYKTNAETYREFFSENNILLSKDDIINVNVDDVIPEDSLVTDDSKWINISDVTSKNNVVRTANEIIKILLSLHSGQCSSPPAPAGG